MALHGSSAYDHDFSEPKKPPQRSGGGLNIVLLVLAVVLLLVLLLPGLRNKVMSSLSFRTQTKIQMGVLVWANKDAGYYYCHGSRFYGHGSGKFMNQGDALTQGFQPALKQYCTEEKGPDSKAVDGKTGRTDHSAVNPSESRPNPAAPAQTRRK